MPITFPCSCGKTLRANDDLAGRRVRCPSCNGAASVPDADPGFEVIEDDPPPRPAPAKAPVKAAPARAKPAARPDDDEDDRPRKRRRDEDDEDEDDRPRKKKRKKKPAAASSGNGGKRMMYLLGGVGLVLVGAVLAYIGFTQEGRKMGKLLVVGILAVLSGFGTAAKGLTGNVDEDKDESDDDDSDDD